MNEVDLAFNTETATDGYYCCREAMHTAQLMSIAAAVKIEAERFGRKL